jgi:hypothetical protein
MSSDAPITFQDVQEYARRYFPDEFAKLPAVTELTWDAKMFKPTSTQANMKIVPMRLLVGAYKSDPSMQLWAYQSLDNSYDIWSRLGTRRKLSKALHRLLHCTGSSNWQICDLAEPFRYALRELCGWACTGDWTSQAEIGKELELLMRYYFLAKGLIPGLKNLDDLGYLEVAVRSNAQQGPLTNEAIHDLISGSRTKLEAVRYTRRTSGHNQVITALALLDNPIRDMSKTADADALAASNPTLAVISSVPEVATHLKQHRKRCMDALQDTSAPEEGRSWTPLNLHSR